MNADIPRMYVEVVFDRPYPENSPAAKKRAKQEIIEQLAQILHTDPAAITVMSMAPGSVRAILKMILSLANSLFTMAERRDAALQEIGIKHVRPITLPAADSGAPSDNDLPLFIPEVLVKIVPYNQLIAGPVRRFLDIPAGYQGLVLRNGLPANRILLPGRRAVAGIIDILWMQPALIEGAIIRVTPVIAPLIVQNFFDANGIQWGLWAQLEIQIVNPQQFFLALSLQSDAFSAFDLIDLLSAEIRPGLYAAVREVAVNRNATATAAEAIRQIVNDLFSTAPIDGLVIKPIERLNIWPLDVAIVQAKSVLKLKNDLVQVYIDASIDRTEQFSVMRDIIAQMAMDFDLPAGMLADVLGQTANFSLSPEEVLAAYVEMLDAIVSSNINIKLNRLRPGKSSIKMIVPAALPEQIRWAHWSRILKLGAGALSLMVAIYSFIVAPLALPEKVINALPLLAELPVTIAMFLIAFRLDERVGKTREQWYANHRLTGRQNQNLQDVDRQVRRQIAGALTTVKNHLVDARKTLYAAGHAEAALALQNVANGDTERLITGVQQPNRGVPRYLATLPGDAAQLETMLDYDAALLRTAALLVHLSEKLRQTATGKTDNPEPGIIEIKNSLAQLTTMFDNRSQTIK